MVIQNWHVELIKRNLPIESFLVCLDYATYLYLFSWSFQRVLRRRGAWLVWELFTVKLVESRLFLSWKRLDWISHHNWVLILLLIVSTRSLDSRDNWNFNWLIIYDTIWLRTLLSVILDLKVVLSRIEKFLNFLGIHIHSTLYLIQPLGLILTNLVLIL